MGMEVIGSFVSRDGVLMPSSAAVPDHGDPEYDWEHLEKYPMHHKAIPERAELMFMNAMTWGANGAYISRLAAVLAIPSSP